jgi:hypothetical protein
VEEKAMPMLVRGKNTVIRCVSLGLLTLSLSAPASAQGIFERIFGGLRNAVEAAHAPTTINAFADPFATVGHAINPPQQRDEFGSGNAFCVRSCDGHFFPVQSRPGLSAAESCNAFCPASQTRLYSGRTIDNAVASDGSTYADLDNAFVYRKQLVDGCTCNGRDQFGLARMDVKLDPTLRPGDVVATKSGLMAFTGTKDKVAEFTPIDNYRGLAQSSRKKLSEVKIMPSNPGAPEDTAATIRHMSDYARGNNPRGAQLSK